MAYLSHARLSALVGASLVNKLFESANEKTNSGFTGETTSELSGCFKGKAKVKGKGKFNTSSGTFHWCNTF